MMRCQLFPRAGRSAGSYASAHAACWTVALFLSFLGQAGCGSSEGYTLAPVSGTVTLDGQPLAGATVTFQPTGGGATAGPGSAAVTDASGKFQLTTAEAKHQSGAVVGNHVVRVSGVQDQRDASDDTQRPATVDPVPVKYRDPGLTFVVPAGGTDKADFQLTSK